MGDPATQTVVATRPQAWSCSFPAIADQVKEARRCLAPLLDGFPPADDALLCLSELVSNAILHSNSARPAGQFTIHATLGSGMLRVEVTDAGGPWKQHDQHCNGYGGRGFVIVDALTRAWGITGDGITSRTIWFEIAAS